MFDKKAVFWNTASQVGVRFVTLAFTLISIKLLSGYLGPFGVGQYNTITTYINFFIVIADLGLFSVTVREIAKKPENEKEIISNVFVVRLVSALAASIIAVLIVFLTDYDSNIKIGALVASGFLFFNLLGSVYDMILQYRLKMQFSAFAELLSKLIAILALYLIIRAGGNFLEIISTVALSGFFIYVFKWLFARRYVAFGPKYNKEVTSWIINISWPLGLVFIINNLYFKLDTLMLFAIKGAEAVGIYSVVFKVLEVTAFIGSYFSSALKPAISENIGKNKPFVGNLLRKSFSIMIFISLPLAIISIVFAKDIILFLSNDKFLSGTNALIMLSLTLPLIYLDTLLAEILIANDERKLLIRIAIFILAFNFLANLVMIPRYSYMGAALTTLLSEVVLLLINRYYTRQIAPFNINFGFILRIVLVGLITLILTVLLKATGLNFLFLIFISLIPYLLLSWVFKIISLGTLKDLLRSKSF